MRFLLLFLCSSVYAFEHLDEKYQIHYGSPSAPAHVIEHFSFSCPKCLDLFESDFSKWKKDIEENKVYFSYHPDPTDLATLQACVCLAQLNEEEKRIFLEAVFTHLRSVKGKSAPLFQSAMKALGKPVEKLSEIEFLEQTDAFQDALAYLLQPDTIQEIPTMEINGVIIDEYPTYETLVKKL